MEIISRRFLDTPTKSVHAATIEFFNGHPVFSWFGGSMEGAGDVSIYLHNLNGNGEHIVIGNKDNVPRWNPILFSHYGHLWLFYKAGVFCDRWQTFVNDITDWDIGITEKEVQSTAQCLPAGLNGPVKTKPIALQPVPSSYNGCRVICGSSVETLHDWTSYIEKYEVGDKWHYVSRSNPIYVEDKKIYRNPFNGVMRKSLGVIQPSIWISTDGKWNSFFRSSGGLDSIYYSKCEAFDKWSDPVPTNLPNPNSGVDTVYHDGKLYLVSNPNDKLRSPLTVQQIEKISDSEWKIVDEVVVRLDIEEEHKSGKNHCISQELSYPYMIENNNQLHLVYTYGRSKIEYCTISI